MRVFSSARFDQSLSKRLTALATPEFAQWEPGTRWASSELIERLAGSDVLLTEEQDPVGLIDAEVCAGAADLKAVVFAGRRPRVDMDAATGAGIMVCNVPGMNSGAVADLTVAFILMCARHIGPAMVRAKAGEWADASDPEPMDWVYRNFTGFELEDKAVGLVGFGVVGREVAMRLQGFRVRILAYDPFVAPEQALRSGAEPVSLDDLLRQSDFVSLHVPMTDDTRDLLRARELGLMKPTAYLINTARAGLVEEKALHRALGERRIAGAALDVFHEEPIPRDSPLLAMPSVIMTPHIGGASSDQVRHHSGAFLDTVGLLARGEAPPSLVNPEVLETPVLRLPRAKA